MDTTEYWPFAHEFSIWNASVTALQFWTIDLDTQHHCQQTVHSLILQ